MSVSRRLFPLLLLLAIIALPVAGRADARPSNVLETMPPPGQRWVAAPGRVEPLSEEIKLSFDMPGRIEDTYFEEGDRLAKGQLVARLQAPEFADRVRTAEAAVQAAQARLDLALAGARIEEKREAKARLRQAEAELARVRTEAERRVRLAGAKAVSAEELERFRQEQIINEERVNAAREELRVAEARTRPEELALARAELAQAQAQLGEAQSLLRKTEIRSPIDGVALRKHRRSGELVSTNFDSPIATVGDVSVLRVRADVDEMDVAKVAVGQRAFVTAEAFGDRRFWGRVIRVSRIMGRKNIRTDEPAERVDTKIMETLIELDAPDGLVTGLRVDAYILLDAGAEGEITAGTPRPSAKPAP